MSHGEATPPTDDLPSQKHYETVSGSYDVQTSTGHIPIPDRFTRAQVVTPETAYYARLYYNTGTNSVSCYLLDPDRHGDYTPFTTTQSALFTVVPAPSSVKTAEYALQVPDAVYHGTPISDTDLQWATTDGTPTLNISTTPARDPIADCGPGKNTIGHIDDTTVFAVNGEFKTVSDDALETANIIDRCCITAGQATASDTRHRLTVTGDAVHQRVPETVKWAATPTAEGSRTMLTPTDGTESSHSTVPVTREENTVTIPLPQSLSNLFDLPNPRGVVWIEQSDTITALV